jgi:anaerobic selenocysteine-containing dehydrogenase
MDDEHFGSCLRRAREERALTIGDVSASTKVPRSAIEMLESGALAGLPAHVFVRGFIRSYAKAVGINDAKPLGLFDRAVNAKTEAAIAESSAPVVDPVLDGTWKVKLLDGAEVEVKTAWTIYQVHLKDYDVESVAEITAAPKELIEQLAKDIATIKPCSIHQGEGINHWFHATEANRAAYLPVMLTGNIGKPGAGCHGWAGNYKAALFQGSKLTGPGFKG